MQKLRATGPTEQFDAINGIGVSFSNRLGLDVTHSAEALVFESDFHNIGTTNNCNVSLGTCPEIQNARDYISSFENDHTILGRRGSSFAASFEDANDGAETDSQCEPHINEVGMSEPQNQTRKASMQIRRKRRRSNSTLIPVPASVFPGPSSSAINKLFLSTNNSFLAEGLLKIYHDSFENALSCWLIERTCPYSMQTGVDASLTNNVGADWNRIYHRVFRLDRSAPLVRGRELTFSQDKAASKALNLAIFSFATQWAQGSERSKARYPFHDSSSGNRGAKLSIEPRSNTQHTTGFDRELQLSAWHEARNALHHAGDIESFRVVFAHIVFSLTQKPAETENVRNNIDEFSPDHPFALQTSVFSEAEDKDAIDYENLLSKIDSAINTDGPPVHLEQGLRLIHSLRSRVAMSGATSRTKSGASLDDTDRNTIDLLFWLGVMFDTLSSAMHKRPLVVSDEDSDIYTNGPRFFSNPCDRNTRQGPNHNSDGLWDGYLFDSQSGRLQQTPVRWPCSLNEATSLLRDAAPVKVLLFRKITRIQTLLARNFSSEKVENSIQAALHVYEYWGKLYAPFVHDCILSHEDLPPRIQSWYICLTGHWHLGALLLADLIEVVDGTYDGYARGNQQERVSSDFLVHFRHTSSLILSDLARCACPQENRSSSFSQSKEFHFAVNQGALLTEPWTAVLIRAFAKAGALLLADCEDDAIRRADDCIQALWYLGRKSDMALSAAKILGDALKARRKCTQEKSTGMSSFLEAELWQSFEDLDHAVSGEFL